MAALCYNEIDNTNLNEDDKIKHFETLIYEKSPIFVLFYAPWCGHCKRFKPILQQYCGKSTENKEVTICAINVDNNRKLSTLKNIQSFPITHIYVNGKKEDEIIGNNQEKLSKLMKKYYDL